MTKDQMKTELLAALNRFDNDKKATVGQAHEFGMEKLASFKKRGATDLDFFKAVMEIVIEEETAKLH